MIYIQSAFTQEEQRLELVGRQGEGGTRQLVFDCADVLAEYPDALIVCAMQRAGDHTAYLKDCATDGTNRAVTLESADVAVPGMLKIELRALIGDDVRKSAVYIAKVAESLRGAQDRPGNPIADVLNRIDMTISRAEESIAEADAAAQSAREVADTVQTKLDNGDFVGPAGKPGSDASVTADNIQAALGYTPVKDVQVAGKSVLANGAAEVPVAKTWVSGEKQLGVMAPSIAHGLYATNGLIQVYPAEKENINSRTLDRPIAPRNLDYAVRAAMCDGKGAAWTTAEQKAARERMGIDREYELIEEITISAGTKCLERNLEPDGTAYNFRKMYVSIITPQAEEDGVIYSLFNNILIGLALGSIKSQFTEGGIAQIYAHVADGFLDGYGVGAQNQSTSSNLIRYVTSANLPSGISAISNMKILATANIPINTNIKIYGARA